MPVVSEARPAADLVTLSLILGRAFFSLFFRLCGAVPHEVPPKQQALSMPPLPLPAPQARHVSLYLHASDCIPA